MERIIAEIIIDGSYGEGGGQIIRTALSLAAITGKAVEIVNVRAGRAKPGLQPQHLMAVRAAAQLCDAVVTGDAAGSQRLSFAPQCPPRADQYTFEIGTAGSTALVLQTALLPLALAAAPSQLRVTGGTHVPHAPAIEYLASVYLPALKHIGVTAACAYTRAGFFPRGGGEVHAEVAPCRKLRCLDLTERGHLVSLKATILTAGLPDHVGERGRETVERRLKGLGRRVEVELQRRDAANPGAAVILTAACEQGYAGFTALGERGKPMELVAKEACTDFQRWWKSGAACDVHLGDQLVLPLALALAHGDSRWTVPTVTDHLRTVLWVAERFLPMTSRLAPRDDGACEVILHG